MMDVYEVHSVEETWDVAKAFSSRLKPGDIVALEGDLGAGKTTWTQGLGSALGVSGQISSPTFALVREHKVLDSKKSIPMLVHMDLYRMADEGDVEAIGWDDYVSSGAVLIIEWPSRAQSLIPQGAWKIVFSYGEKEEDRRIEISRFGED